MSGIDFKSPVVDSVPRVNEEVAVGEDIAFQRKWWIFEQSSGHFSASSCLLTVLGVFGRGPVAISSKAIAGRGHHFEVRPNRADRDTDRSEGPVRAECHPQRLSPFIRERVGGE